MKLNQRGEFATALIVVMVVGGVLVGALGATKLNPFKLFHRDSANRKASWTKWDEKITPKLLTDKQGNAVAVGPEIHRTYDTGKEDVKPAPTYGERVASFFAGLTNIGFLVIAGLLIFCPSLLIGTVWRWGAKWKHALKTTVKGIREAPPEAAEKVKVSLAASHDKKDKKAIDEIKKELH